MGLLSADCMGEWAIRAGGGVLVCLLARGLLLLLLLEKVVLPVELLPLCIHVFCKGSRMARVRGGAFEQNSCEVK